MLHTGMSLEDMKLGIKALRLEYFAVQRLTQEKKLSLSKAVHVLQAKCTHPEHCLVTHRVYDERSKECTYCGYEF